MDGEAGWWTTSGDIGLPPLAKVMGVGRQEQLEWSPLSQRGQEARLILFYIIINSLAQVPFESVRSESYKGTRINPNMKLDDRLVIKLASMDSHFPIKPLVHGTGLLSLNLRHWLYLHQIFFFNWCATIPHNTLEGSCGM